MKKKVLFCTLLSVVVLALGLVLSSSNSVNVESEKCHDCSEHLAEAKLIIDDRCEACFRYPDEYGLCPMCDYEDCPNCGEWKQIKNTNYCTNCNDRNPNNSCHLCGKLFKDCICD